MKIRGVLFTVAILLVGEVLSFFGWRFPVLGVIGWVGIVGCIGFVALKRPEIALGIVIAELILGGKGYLFSVPVGSADISLRLGIFLVIFCIWAIQALRTKNLWGTQKSFQWLWLGWIAIAAWAAVVGVVRNHGVHAVFEDANAFLFLGLAPAFGLLQTREHFYTVLRWAVAAIIILALKTALVQGLFSHYPSTELVLLYKWVRDTGVGEITYIIGHLYRVFFQSHIYGLLAFFTGIGLAIAQPHRRWWWAGFAGLGAFAVVVSLSRSFWLGGLVAISFGIGGALFQHVQPKTFVRVGMYAGFAMLVALLGFQWMLNFPGLWGGGGSGGTLVRARSDIQTESAASSRRELLPVITKAIFTHPILGSGFGTALTYQTKDPRVNTTKQAQGVPYTTTAFELGYHALAMQFGILLFIAWLGLLARFFYRAFQAGRTQFAEQPIVSGLFLSVLAVSTLHLTTPYLNHPLGFGFFFLLASALALFNPQYAKR